MLGDRARRHHSARADRIGELTVESGYGEPLERRPLPESVRKRLEKNNPDLLNRIDEREKGPRPDPIYYKMDGAAPATWPKDVPMPEGWPDIAPYPPTLAGEPLYRGLRVDFSKMPNGDEVRSGLSSDPDRYVPMLLDHVSESGVGTHWTPNRHIADGFAADFDNDDGVVLQGTWGGEGWDPNRTDTRGNHGPEQEVTLLPGANVDISGIYHHSRGEDGKWSKGDFAPLSQPQTRTAALPETQKCEYCDEQATQRVIHSEGMGYIPCCDAHLEDAELDAIHCVPGDEPDPTNIVRVDKISRVAAIPDGYQVHLMNTSGYGGGIAGLYPKGVKPTGSNWHSAIAWDNQGKIDNIDTKPRHQGKGLARSLYDHVKSTWRPDLMHDRSLTPDGKAFSQAVGGQMYDNDEWERRYQQNQDEKKMPWEERDKLWRSRGWPDITDVWSPNRQAAAEQPKTTTTLYRGIGISPPEGFMGTAEDLARKGDLEGVVSHILNHASQGHTVGSGLGAHWSTDPEVAKGFARGGTGMPVLLKAEWDGQGHNTDYHNPFGDESEITLHPDTPLTLTGVHFQAPLYSVPHAPRQVTAGLHQAEQEYWMDHRAPTNDGYCVPMHALHQMIPDVHERPQDYHGGTVPENLSAIRRSKDSPDTKVKIYRAMPRQGRGGYMINPGDWVTTNREYAVLHGLGGEEDGRNMPVVQATVPAKHLYSDGNSLEEWGYDPGHDQPKAAIVVARPTRGL